MLVGVNSECRVDYELFSLLFSFHLFTKKYQNTLLKGKTGFLYTEIITNTVIIAFCWSLARRILIFWAIAFKIKSRLAKIFFGNQMSFKNWIFTIMLTKESWSAISLFWWPSLKYCRMKALVMEKSCLRVIFRNSSENVFLNRSANTRRNAIFFPIHEVLKFQTFLLLPDKTNAREHFYLLFCTNTQSERNCDAKITPKKFKWSTLCGSLDQLKWNQNKWKN